MTGRLFARGFGLILGALILSSCGPLTVRPTETPRPLAKEPIAEPIETAPTVAATLAVESSDARAARDAALAVVSEDHGDQAPSWDVTWTEEYTPQEPFRLPNYRYTAEGWEVVISYRTLPILYQVVVANQATGFRWEGTVEASGEVTEQLSAAEIRAARDAALGYLSERYADQFPAPGTAWVEQRSIPEVWSGAGVYHYAPEEGAGEWAVRVYYPMMPSEMVVYLVIVTDEATGFHWVGEVDAAGRVTEPLDELAAARDIALAYVREHYGKQAPRPRLRWTEDYAGVPVPEGPWGAGTLQCTYVAGEWALIVSYQFLDPEPDMYEVMVSNPTTQFHWQGQVDAAGQVTEVYVSPGA